MGTDQALTKLFKSHSGNSTFRQWKKRFYDGEMTENKKEFILKKFGFRKKSEVIWQFVKN